MVDFRPPIFGRPTARTTEMSAQLESRHEQLAQWTLCQREGSFDRPQSSFDDDWRHLEHKMRDLRIGQCAGLGLVLLCALLVPSGARRQVHGYFYQSNAGPIIDFQNSLLAPGEHPRRPWFLYNATYQKPRIVNFYAHWSPDCKRFRNQYVKFAKQLDDLARQVGAHIDIYAVSCSRHLEICRDKIWAMKHIPTLISFKAGETNFTKVWHKNLRPVDVLRHMGVDVDAQQLILKDHVEERKGLRKLFHRKKAYAERRTKGDVFNDAYLSLDFALRNEIFDEDGPLSVERAEVFKSFLELMHKTLPLSWHIQSLIVELLNDFIFLKRDQEELLEVADRFPPPNEEWSLSCSHGDPNQGYSCGLWNLFHIVTVGMVEWNRQIAIEQEMEGSRFHPEEEKDKMIFPIEAATTLRNYIESFMVCTECREGFVSAFDSSWHNLDDRIVKSNETMDGWIELPVWLFEMHNAVNIRLMKEKAVEANHIVSDEDVLASTWPTRKACPQCFNEEKGSWKKAWHKKETFNYLRLEYWPEDDISFEIRSEFAEKSSGNGVPSLALGFLPFASIAILCVGLFFRRLQRRKIRQLKNY